MRQVELEIGERQLSSGLTVIGVRNAAVPTFAAGVALDVDMRDEEGGQEGLAHLLGESLDEGTVHRGGVELAEAVDEIGGTISGNSSGGTIMCPAKNAEASLALLREMVFEPAFSEREVHRVKDEILQEIRVEESDPRHLAHLRFRKEVYGPHPFARPSHGSAQALSAHEPPDLHAFHGQWFGPGEGYVAAAGPAPVEETLSALEREFAGMEGSAVEHRRPEPPPMPASGIDVHIPLDREQVHIYLGHRGIRRMDPDFYALAVMDYILGTGPGFTSRISKRLRDEMGLCYTVSATITSTAGEEPGCFSAYIGTSAEHRGKSIAGFLEEIERIRQEEVTEKELVDVQNYLTGSYIFAFERNTQLARYAVRAKRFDLGFDHVRKYPDLIRSVTRADVLRVAQQHLHPENMVRISAGAGSS